MPTTYYDQFGDLQFGFSTPKHSPDVALARLYHSGKIYTITFQHDKSTNSTTTNSVVVTKGDILELCFQSEGCIHKQLGNDLTQEEWDHYRLKLAAARRWENSPEGDQAIRDGIMQGIQQGNQLIFSSNDSQLSNDCAATKLQYERQKNLVQSDENLLSSMEKSGSIFSATQSSNLAKHRQFLYQLQNKLSNCH
jgi:hypothetical protein